jgi:pimeloyl-ACP methyl ester carboxylesterase
VVTAIWLATFVSGAFSPLEECALAQVPAAPPFRLLPLDAVTREVSFSSQGAVLAGQIDFPRGQDRPPLLVVIHHSGPVDRDAYQYFAAAFVPHGFAVFRFDKRGTGRSSGDHGCCEGDDAVAAYRAAVAATGFDPRQVFIVAQSLGTRIVADRYVDFEAALPPAGVVLMSSLLRGDAVLAVRAPIHIVVSDSEPDLQALGEAAVQAHRAKYPFGASVFVAPHTEHTLFDTSRGPIDWSSPDWPDRFSAPARESLLRWLRSQAGRG